MTPAEEKIPGIIRNEFFYAFARVCMVVSTLIGLPVATWMLQRVVSTADDIRAQLQTQSTALMLLNNEVKFHFANVDDHDHDHEIRLRRLELGSR